MIPATRGNNYGWLPELFSDLFNLDYMPKVNGTAPAINVIENDDSYKVELAAPGLNKEDFEVHINDEGNLVVKMEKKTENKEEDKKNRYLRREFNYSKFEQTLLLPDDVNKEAIAAKMDNGILVVDLPKVAPVAKAVGRKISVE